MNKIERAIEALKMENELMQFDPNTGEDYPIELQNQDNQDLYNANLIAISALEKQMPKKPINDGSNIRYTPVYSCPKCENRITGTGIASYCYHCGQKLDWR